MTKLLLGVVMLAGLAFAQRNLGPIGHGFGNVVFPGTGIPRTPTGHIPNLSSTIRGVYPTGPGRPHHGRPSAVLPVPVYVGGYGYGYGYAPQEPQQPITIVNAPPAVPSVIINQQYTPDRAQPVVREYAPPSGDLGSYEAPVPSHPDPVKPAAPAVRNGGDKPTVYLIALKDGTVYSAYAFWLEADTLHYITTKHSHNRASLSLVDEALSLQLNSERRVDFNLKTR